MTINLHTYSDTLSAIELRIDDSLHSSWPLRYPVYQFDHGNITGDKTVIAVGVIKPTRFDPKPDKRLFLFKITDDNYIRPLWLGSRVAQPLEDFKVINSLEPALIRTIEREQDGTFLVAKYKWRGFGLEFIDYIRRGISLEEAQKLLQKG
ncbi:nuclear receptor-binding factor 2 [Dysgonomonas sp. 521]|nr:nuclear receptor-binding factor 2 [Dysgonomonas sp. 521]